ncbi:LamG domain-containing protein [Pontixanthobacter aquaemixtae]|uniref:LamG-like jellyroll fold domain-containing protein n=1 Tax=Pontixanthobacter aquaemixtae TaxID=1958940 RepID=A0A844ZNK5_9SPHN|nr:LamG domain-containing protein [Pontixanthobacter aquaemixtae]MXO89283.1 hypothetical protein [Pontixanthobacter aquaemixtae]
MLRTITSLLAAMLLALPVVAQDSQYLPDVLELDGQTTLNFPADESLDLSGGATIEFWVQPDWTDAPQFDPVILSYAGTEGASYLVAMLRDRDGIGIMTGETFEVAPFDFSDSKMHHVVLIDYGNQIEVLVDNALVAILPVTIQSLSADGLFIGSSDGENDPFLGALAGVRLWGLPVAQDVVANWRMRDVLSNEEQEHPDLRFLVGHSAFQSEDFLLANAEPNTENEGN